MTRLYYSAGRLRLKIVLSLGACAVLFGVVDAAAGRRFLGLSAPF